MIKMWLIVLFLGVVTGNDARGNIKIGVIMYENSPDMVEVLSIASEHKINNKTINLHPMVKFVQHGDIRRAEDHVCELIKEGVYAIVDTTLGQTSAHIQAVCDSVEMPHILTNHNYLQSKNWSAVNLYPSHETYNRILVDLIREKEWQNFTILYIKGHTMSSVSKLLELHSSIELFTVSVRELSGNNYRPEFAAAKKRQSVNFLVDCPANKLTQVLRQAQEVGLMSNKHSYIFTSTDLHTLNLDQFKYGGANITGFKLINVEDESLREQVSIFDNLPLVTNKSMLFDAMRIIAYAYDKLPVQPVPLNCGVSETWRHGSSVINIMRTNIVQGLSREIIFNSEGKRSNFTFDIFELTRAGIINVAKWKEELKITRNYMQTSSDDKGIMRNKTFAVLISLTPPYAFVKETVNDLSGNDRYEGFAIDIIDELSQKLGFSYIFTEEASAGTYKNNEATGMTKLIMENKADFAIADLTMTAERQSVLDFTTPFMTVGISILYKKPSKQPPAMFSFMDPFAKEVWIYMMLAQIFLALLIVFVGRISHKEWHNPFPCVEQPESLVNQFSIANAMWLIIGSVMQQGSEIAPIALGTRTVTSVWWFFTMVMISSYTGTLVAFLTVESKPLPFKSAEDLYNLNYIEYGAKKDGATLTFFAKNEKELYRNMYKHMARNDFKSCPSDNTQGRERVQAGGYAFFMESAAIEYELERNCDLMQVGDPLDTKTYGIGMIKNSPYRAELSNGILKMKEMGTLQKLKDKWWKERRGGGACTDADKGSDTKQLEMKNMVGAFVVLGVGCIIGILISILDMLWGVYKKTIKFGTSYRTELMEELRFALKFSGDTKPVKRRPKTASDDEVLETEAEARDELESLKSIGSSGSAGTHNTRQSYRSHRSSRSLSVALARRRRYS